MLQMYSYSDDDGEVQADVKDDGNNKITDADGYRDDDNDDSTIAMLMILPFMILEWFSQTRVTTLARQQV